MADNNVFNEKDSMDINELAALNDDISPELIEQLQQKLTQDATSMSAEMNPQDDAALFEEPAAENTSVDQSVENKPQIDIDKNFDDNFIKKYKAKLNRSEKESTDDTISAVAFSSEMPEQQDEGENYERKYKSKQEETNDEIKRNFKGKSQNEYNIGNPEEPISKISSGKIIEKAISKEQISYNDSLDFLDGNVKYSKYVIYIDPQNVDFIESLTVKERKNLINSILRQQDDIKITKRRFRVVQTVIRHAIVAIMTIAIFIPIIYLTINASLEATINNYRRSQTNWQVLYKEHGKIMKNN